MSSLQMPKVDSSILSKKDKIVSDIGRIINPKNVLSHPDELRPFETDGLTAYRQMPLVVVMPETVEEVSNILKYCNDNKVKVVPRNVKRRIEVVGHGTVTDHHTSDLWVWAGVGKHKGKDFAVTGTHSADGEAYFWDITDPSKMTIIDTIKVDARTVNDVKISEDGRVGIISREGASNRKNGLVILDVTDPYNVTITKMYDDDLTGGVHNVFIYQDHVYALSAGTRYDIINISDPANPFRVSSYELDTPGHSIHDVWVENGIAYSSNWADGVHIVDVEEYHSVNNQGISQVLIHF